MDGSHGGMALHCMARYSGRGTKEDRGDDSHDWVLSLRHGFDIGFDTENAV